MSEPGIHVVKLGGSLLDLPDFMTRFEVWRRTELSERGVLVVGGGVMADVVRDFDRRFKIGEEPAHRCAILAMGINTQMVLALLKGCQPVMEVRACPDAWKRNLLAVVEPWAWVAIEASRGDAIPHRWTFTSDSIAAHVATRLGAGKLTLLKSTLPPSDCGPECAAGLGIVDEDFPETAKTIPAIELVNLRSTPVGRCVLR